MTVAERIKMVRKNSKDKTQKAFGETLGVSSHYVYCLEAGRETPSDRLLKDISRLYGVDIYWLMEGGSDEIEYVVNTEASAIIDAVMQGDNDFIKQALVKLASLDKKYWDMIEEIIEELKKD